eukprot:12414861-Karenia_brevis.AAC.1
MSLANVSILWLCCWNHHPCSRGKHKTVFIKFLNRHSLFPIYYQEPCLVSTVRLCRLRRTAAEQVALVRRVRASLMNVEQKEKELVKVEQQEKEPVIVSSPGWVDATFYMCLRLMSKCVNILMLMALNVQCHQCQLQLELLLHRQATGVSHQK